MSAPREVFRREPVVLVTLEARVPPVAGVRLVRARLGEVPEAEGLLCGPPQALGAADVAAMPRLRVVGVAGAGTDRIDRAALDAAGIRLCTAAAQTAPATADLALLLLLMAARRVEETAASLRAGRWPGWRFDDAPGKDLQGATLGLVGHGHIARLVERRARALDMEVVHHTRTPTGESGWHADLASMLPRCDGLSLHVPLTDATRGLVGGPELDLLRPGAVVVNTSRGGVLDEQALCDRLDDGRLFGAGLDVFEGEPAVHPRLLETPHLVLTPHIGSATGGARARMVRGALDGVLEVLGVPGDPAGEGS